MAYTIKNSDGTVLLTLPDRQIDQIATSLTLIGQNYSSYGEFYNTNLVALLENFSTNGIPPRSPLVGQLWYNKSDARLYVYTMQRIFQPVSNAVVSPSEPTAPNIGDFWIDSINKQLYFTSDGIDFTLAGPPDSAIAPNIKNGWYADQVDDIFLNSATIAALYNNDALIAIASSSTFSFNTPYFGMAGVMTGINLNNSIPGIRFNGTAVNSDTVNTFTNNYLLVDPPAEFPNITYGALYISTNSGLIVGLNQDVTLQGDSFFGGSLVSNRIDYPFRFTANSSVIGGNYVSSEIRPNDAGRTAVYYFPGQSLSGGLINVEGDLTVIGEIDATQPGAGVLSGFVYVRDNDIQLNYSAATDATADQGGLKLIGSSTYSILWDASSVSWNSNQNFNLSNNLLSYKIDQNPVLTYNSLGIGINSAPGLTSIGALTLLTVTNITISSGTIDTIAINSDLYLTANGSGNINVLNNKITNVNTCTLDSDAANKLYVDSEIANAVAIVAAQSRAYTLNMDITGIVSVNDFIEAYLEVLIPISNPGEPYFDLPDGTRCIVLCTELSSTSPGQVVSYPSGAKSYVQVDKNNVPESQSVLLDVQGQISSSTQVISLVRSAKEFRVVSGTWNWSADLSLPPGPY